MDEPTLILDGTEGPRYCRAVIIDGQEIIIQGTLFHLLLKLAAARLGGEGWLSYQDLADLNDPNVGNRMREYIRRLRRATHLPIETLHGGGMYRLNLEGCKILFRHNNLN